jgi:hypothetical protein
MSLRSRRSLAAAIAPLLLSINAPFVHGQSVVPAARPDPLNPRAEVPATTYKSALGRYRPAGEVKVGSWRDANDTVTRIGGWRTYTREANQPEGADAPAAPASAPASPSPAAPAVAPTAPAASGPAPTPARPAGGHGDHGKR